MDPPPSLVGPLTGTPAAVGTFFKSGSANLAEALCQTPLDFLLIDCQHASPSLETVEAVVRAADLQALPVMARLPHTDVSAVNSLLDAGISALMVPQVDDPQTVADIADAARYDERRSFATSTRAGRFGQVDLEAYLDFAANGIAIVPQIETRAGLDAVEAIAAATSTTALMIGPGDLSHALGVSPGDQVFEEAVDRVFAAADEHDVGVGTYVGSAAEIELYAERGATFLLFKSDIGLAVSHLESVLPPNR